MKLDMKRTKCLAWVGLWLVLTLMATVQPGHAATVIHATITQDHTAGYGIPGAKHTVLAYFPKGEVLTVNGRSRDRRWLQVAFMGNAIWIAHDSATLDPAKGRITPLRLPARPKAAPRSKCVKINEEGFAAGALPDVVLGLRNGACLTLMTKNGESQTWLWHPANSMFKPIAFAPVMLRYGPWGLPAQNFDGRLMFVNWVTDKQGRRTYASATSILQREDMLYYELTPLIQIQKRGELLLMSEVHGLERIQ